jgi:hypothetical protein
MNSPYSIRIFMPTGDPEGIRTIEKSNWVGSGLVFPRALFKSVMKRPELDRAGVYALIGPPESSGMVRIYVGEGDPIKDRLYSHSASKDFWTWCLAFSGKDGNLNKAHVQHLESRLINLAKLARRCELDNANQPGAPTMSEADAADAEGFLRELLLCLPAIGLNVFQVAEAPKLVEEVGAHVSTSPSTVQYQLHVKGLHAIGVESTDGFLVLAGSEAVLKESPGAPLQNSIFRKTLIEKGILIPSGDRLKLAIDYVFNSPSQASGTLVGRASNGRTEWRTREGKTLREIQDGLLTEGN